MIGKIANYGDVLITGKDQLWYLTFYIFSFILKTIPYWGVGKNEYRNSIHHWASVYMWVFIKSNIISKTVESVLLGKHVKGCKYKNNYELVLKTSLFDMV